jgi:hypothetical protein
MTVCGSWALHTELMRVRRRSVREIFKMFLAFVLLVVADQVWTATTRGTVVFEVGA